MQKAKLIADCLSQEFSPHRKKQCPAIFWKVLEETRSEKFSIINEWGNIQVEGESALAAAYGVSKARIGIKSGHLAEFFGETHPCFPLRPLWVGGTYHVKLSDDLGLSLPSSFKEQSLQTLELWCRRIIELGFNAILLGSRESLDTTVFQSCSFDLNSLCALFHEYGLQVLIKPTLLNWEKGCCPLNPSYRIRLQSCLNNFVHQFPEIDFIMWESLHLHPSFIRDSAAQDFTMAEIVLEELRLIEGVCPFPIIYYIPMSPGSVAKQQVTWLSNFCDDVGPQTIVSFAAVAGDLCEDHLPAHPFWEHLRQSYHVSATRLLPIINVGGVLQGEGLWPAVPLDLLENYYCRLHRHCFAGAITMVNGLPKEGGLLDCSLWAASQCLWGKNSPKLLVETWFQAFQADWEFAVCWEFLEDIRRIIVELSFLRSLTKETQRETISLEECRTMTESILSRLKNLQMRMEKMAHRDSNKFKKFSFTDYLNFFVRDAQRIILYFLQYYNLSYPHLFLEEDLQDTFWTQLSQSGQGIRAGSKVKFFDEPKRDSSNSKIENVFLQSRFF